MLNRTEDESLYSQLVSMFRTRIASGDLPPGARLPTELELAREYNISRGTVRQAMSVLVNEELLERVPGRGTFVRFASARPTESASTNRRIGLLLSYRRSDLDLDILSGVEHIAKTRGYQVSFAYTEESSEQQTRDIARLRDDQVAGMIIYPLSDVTHDQAIWQLHADGVPFVLVDRYFDGLNADYVSSDNTGGGFRATEHLIILGHTHIGFVHASTGTLLTSSVRDRFEGYRRALAEYGLPYDEALVFQRDFKYNGNQYAEFLARPDRPSAIFGSNDREAGEVIRAAHQLGIATPDDLAVVGFDNVQFAAYINPPLTTIAQPARDIGLNAADLLISRIEGKRGPAKHIELPTNLVVRESCGVRLHIKAATSAK